MKLFVFWHLNFSNPESGNKGTDLLPVSNLGICFSSFDFTGFWAPKKIAAFMFFPQVELSEEEADDPEEVEAGQGDQDGNILEPQVTPVL